MMKKIILASVGLIFLIGSLLYDIDLSFLIVFYVWLLSIVYTSTNLRKRILYFMFLISFFVFLLGGHFVYEYFGMELKYFSNYEVYVHSNNVMALSLGVILVTYFVIDKIGNSFTLVFKHKKEKTDDVESLNLRKISILVFYILYPLYVLLVVDKISYVITHSYIDYYANYVSNVPAILQYIGVLAPYFLFIFLATMPPKRQTLVPLGLYGLYGVLSLLTGRRITFAVIVMFLISYFIIRQLREGNDEVWFTKKMVYTGVFASIFGIMFLYAFNYTRVGEGLSDLSLVDMFMGFFQQQGFSSSILRLGVVHEEALNEDVVYSVFGTVKWFRTNLITRTIFNPQYDFSYLHNSVGLATNGNSFSNALGYVVLNESTYLSGVGLGSCYIAELFYDFGYKGIIIGSALYGVAMAMVSKGFYFMKASIWRIAFGFAIFEAFIKAPRWYYDIIVTYALDIALWFSIFALFAFTYKMNKNRKVFKYGVKFKLTNSRFKIRKKN